MTPAERAQKIKDIQRAQKIAEIRAAQGDVAKNTLRESGALMDNAPDATGDVSPPQSQDWRDTQLPMGTTPRGLIQGGLDALPFAGMLGGGAIGGAGTLGLGAIAGAGLGAGAGEAAKNLGEKYLLGKDKTREEIYGDPARAILEGGVGEMGGQILGKALQKGMSAGGKALYKSGLKRIDQEVAKYGKEPVSDLLMKHDIAGNSKQIFDQMNELGDKLLAQRNDILKQATRKGAEVDIPAALKDAQVYVDKLKGTDNPELRKAVKMLEKRIAAYGRMGAKEAQPITRELPYTEPGLNITFKQKPEVIGYDAPTLSNPAAGELDNFSGKDLVQKPVDPRGAEFGRFKKVLSEPVVRDPVDELISLPVQGDYDLQTVLNPKTATVLDLTERKPGPSPIQTTKWKTTSANNVGKNGWKELSMSPEGKGFDKALSGGLRAATEKSVGEALGPDFAQNLSARNSELGQILSSRERALLDAEQAARRNAFSSVDGMIAGAGNPAMLAVKKAADLAKMTGPRTLIGRSVNKAGEGELMQAIRDNPEVQGMFFEWLLRKRKGLVKEGLVDDPAEGLISGESP